MKTSKVHIPIEMVENMEIRSKYYLLPLLLWGKTFDRGTRPYQDFEVLIRLRNYLVHYKMTPSGGGEMPKFAEHLKDKNLLMTSGTPGVGLAGGLLTELCSAKAALWAYNTTCQMATNLIQLADDTTKQLWQGMLDNFREIPDQYWKSLIPASKPT
jgi:hypothetical protein